jgi:hypothetical protein
MHQRTRESVFRRSRSSSAQLRKNSVARTGRGNGRSWIISWRSPAITESTRSTLLNSTAELAAPRKSRRFRIYDEAVKEALVVLWEASDRICGKRLKALIPILVPALERHGHLDLDAAVRKKLLLASAATIDRLLSDTRAAVRGSTRPTRRAQTSVQRRVPIRTAGDWDAPGPGYAEVDLVSHCGGDPSGSFAHPHADRCLQRLDRMRSTRRS